MNAFVDIFKVCLQLSRVSIQNRPAEWQPQDKNMPAKISPFWRVDPSFSTHHHFTSSAIPTSSWAVTNTSNKSSPRSGFCQACLPHERLFQGETDGSSFPNGGLRVTHSAAAFTTWDRASPPFVMDKCPCLNSKMNPLINDGFVYKKPSKWGKFNGPSFTILADLRCLYIPCAFVTHFGKCIDEKTPLLRSMDAVTLSGLRLLKAIGIATDAKAIGRKQSGNPDRESGEVSRENTWRLPFVGDVGWKAFESRQKLLYGCQPASKKN